MPKENGKPAQLDVVFLTHVLILSDSDSLSVLPAELPQTDCAEATFPHLWQEGSLFHGWIFLAN